MTTEQEQALQEINDRWGAASWREYPGRDMAVVLEVTLDSGETVDVSPDGSYTV